MLESARSSYWTQVVSVHCWKCYSLDQSSMHASTPSNYSNPPAHARWGVKMCMYTLMNEIHTYLPTYLHIHSYIYTCTYIIYIHTYTCIYYLFTSNVRLLGMCLACYTHEYEGLGKICRQCMHSAFTCILSRTSSTSILTVNTVLNTWTQMSDLLNTVTTAWACTFILHRNMACWNNAICSIGLFTIIFSSLTSAIATFIETCNRFIKTHYFGRRWGVVYMFMYVLVFNSSCQWLLWLNIFSVTNILSNHNYFIGLFMDRVHVMN